MSRPDHGEVAQEASEAGHQPSESEQETTEVEQEMADLRKRYEPGARPTVVVPGSGGTVSGTAFADLVSDDEPDDSDSSGDRSVSD